MRAWRSSTRTPASSRCRPSRTSPTRPRSSTRCPTWTSTSAPWWPRTSTSASCTCTSTRPGRPTRPSTASWAPATRWLSRKLVEMASAIAGGREKLRERPIISFITCPVSPLKLVQDTCEIIMTGAREHIAVNILSMAMAGGSSPVTLAGTLVTHNAEVLAGITLSQLTQPGAKVVYGSSTTAMDLRLASASVGSPECGAHQRRRRPDRPLLPAAQLGRGCVGRLQDGRCPKRPREDPDRPYAGVGRRQPDLRSGDDRVGHDLRLRPARHGRRVRRHDQAVRPRHPRGRRGARHRRDRRHRSVRRLPQPRPHHGAHARAVAACGDRPSRPGGLDGERFASPCRTALSPRRARSSRPTCRTRCRTASPTSSRRSSAAPSASSASGERPPPVTARGRAPAARGRPRPAHAGRGRPRFRGAHPAQTPLFGFLTDSHFTSTKCAG